MFAYATKVNKKVYYYTGKGMSIDVNEAKRAYSKRFASEFHYHAKVTAENELGASSIEIVIVGEAVPHQQQGVFLTEEFD